MEYLFEIEFQPEKEDMQSWRFATNGKFSVKSAYEGFFRGLEFEPYERTWQTWAPAKCRFFIWLVAHKKC
jgi:hypothetical protein